MSTRNMVLRAKGLAFYEEGGPPCRQLWYSSDFERNLEGISNAAPPQCGWRGPVEPAEQIELFFREFAYNRRFKNANLLTWMRPTSDGILEVRLPDVRLIGWYYQISTLILHSAGMATAMKQGGYDDAKRKAKAYRSSLRLPREGFIYNSKWLPSAYLVVQDIG